MSTADLARAPRTGAYERSVRRLNRLERRLAQALPVRRKKKPEGKLKLTSRTSKAAFLKSVRKTKEYVASGDVFRCVLSQRFDFMFPKSTPSSIYRALRIFNPSPYMPTCLRLRPRIRRVRPANPTTVGHIVGSSPELLDSRPRPYRRIPAYRRHAPTQRE